MESDGLLLQTLFCIQKTIVLAQEASVQAACITNVLHTWSQLCCHRNATITASTQECDMIEAFLFDLLKSSAQNVALQNVAVHAILSWIHHYLPRIRRGQKIRRKKTPRKSSKVSKQLPSAVPAIALCAQLLQMRSFNVEPKSVACCPNLSNVSSSIDSYEFVSHVLQQIVDGCYAFEQHTDSKTVWSGLRYILQRIVNGCVRDPNRDASLLRVLQIIHVYGTSMQSQSQSQSPKQDKAEIDEIANICFSMIDRFHPSSESEIGAVISSIAQTHCFKDLFVRLPNAYRGMMRKHEYLRGDLHAHRGRDEEMEKYKNQLQSLLETDEGHAHARAHPLRVFESSSLDLSEQLNHISLDIRRRKYQKQRATVTSVTCDDAPPSHIGYGINHGIDVKECERDELLCSNGNNSEAELMRSVIGRKRNWTKLHQVDDDKLLPQNTLSPPKKMKYIR